MVCVQSSRLGEVSARLVRQEEETAGLTDRLGQLARQGQDHRDLILAIEKSLRDKAAELDQDLKSYKTSSREDIRTLRKFFAHFLHVYIFLFLWS
jgi:predicted  nucleic acid-binding Zn-ribbon protein